MSAARDTAAAPTRGADLPLDGRVALVTGAARGQGRAHAVRLARDGARVVLVDRDHPGEACTEVRDAGGTALARTVDVRDLDALTAVVAEAVAELSGLDIVVANAGIARGMPLPVMSAAEWQEVIDVNLTGAWNTVRACAPAMIDRGRGGAIVFISSAVGGLKAGANLTHYAASKHGLVGLMRSLAAELATHSIRVNSVHPTAVDTAMIHNEATYRLFRPDLDSPTRDDVAEAFTAFHSLPVAWVQPEDVSNAVAFLVSDRARYVTGVALPVDAGLSAR